MWAKMHDGGYRCQQEDCSKSAQGNTRRCVVHGGGNQYQQEGCPESAQGSEGYCKAHRGGKRYQQEGCLKSVRVQGSTGYRKAYGGGRTAVYAWTALGRLGAMKIQCDIAPEETDWFAVTGAQNERIPS